ncbi:hypothetical protein SEPCBS119000_004671 [Sporothrix epigloea]|uniref:Thioredoxin domain-containing protein n=1 Tax=Sporothrix epigloea TaxID=1892477 RepID=A0ABP0DVL2_9PEZI
MTTKINSLQQWRQVTSANSIVVTDFYADWCGPCKMIAPTFEALATKFAKPNRIAFAKVDVDSHRDIAQQYGVRAMPTFVILRNGSVHETLQGANPPALTAAVEKAVKLATGGGSTFSTPGRALGTDASASSAASIRVGAGASRPPGGPIQGHRSWFDPMRIVQWLISFIGLYLTTLFSVSLATSFQDTLDKTYALIIYQIDPYMAAQNRSQNRQKLTTPAHVSSGAPFGGRTFQNSAGLEHGMIAGASGTAAVKSNTSGGNSSSKSSGPQQRGGFKTLADLN